MQRWMQAACLRVRGPGLAGRQSQGPAEAFEVRSSGGNAGSGLSIPCSTWGGEGGARGGGEGGDGRGGGGKGLGGGRLAGKNLQQRNRHAQLYCWAGLHAASCSRLAMETTRGGAGRGGAALTCCSGCPLRCPGTKASLHRR
jgi:hypothetical protein